MFGASNLKWIDAEYGNLDRFEELVIATEMDGTGETYVTKFFEPDHRFVAVPAMGSCL